MPCTLACASQARVHVLVRRQRRPPMDLAMDLQLEHREGRLSVQQGLQWQVHRVGDRSRANSAAGTAVRSQVRLDFRR